MDGSFLSGYLGVISILILVLANGFFVAAEFSIINTRRAHVADMLARDEIGASAVQKAVENPDRIISVTQLGITISSLALGWVGEPVLSQIINPIFPVSIAPGLSRALSAALSFLILVFLHIMIGELAPKSIALQNPERTSLAVAGPTLIFETLFKPVTWLLDKLGNALLRLLGIRPSLGQLPVHTVEELKMLVTASVESGVVEAEESEMLHAIIDFGELVVRQVMVPRTEMTAVEADMPLDEIINLITHSTYTKFPVYEESLDQIVGIVHVKDLLHAIQKSHSQDLSAQDLSARTFAREALFVPETIAVSALLRHFRDNRQHIAIVMDEYGGTAGLVTLEDILEEIVGEVSDPFDLTAPEFQRLEDGSVLIDGLTLIEEVNDQLGVNLDEPNYDTIAGYVLGKLNRLARVGDVVEGDGARLRVHEMDGLRIARISLTRLVQPQLVDSTSAPVNEQEKHTVG